MVTAQELCDQFAAVLVDLDANPREVSFEVRAPGAVLGYDRGEPVFEADGVSVRASFRGRWLAEHAVPLTFGTKHVFKLSPTSGNRVKVRVK